VRACLAPHARLSAVCALVAVIGIASHAQAQDQKPDRSRRLRGGAFEAGLVLGSASFPKKSLLASCRWNGVRFGHRFEPFKGNERIQLGFRMGVEGCMSKQPGIGRTDLIYANAGLLFGVRASDSWLIHWFSGVGELLGDTTFNPEGEVDTRFAWMGEPGVTWALSDRFVLDASVMGIVFENFTLVPNPPRGTVFGFIPSLMFALQI